ncbi:ADP-forming succinate--CoA ligase subunit beta [Pantoea sp. Mhis]|uniref:ADP-forming succinate--CoA ligase subunit beta n=1 Tax=Pantoea sp. Mhis TaxID=2576759 RepID=UPI00135A038E|nr:ADP-forming succinate--CoA ligase subunit beta [Pantoea sp. Mhis]MXP56288.1 ADP-forming succinate--CoA ligase subunit beta [Pantoea sp. Mhis]
MNLHEYQAKQLFIQYNMLVPIGYICTTPYEAQIAASKIGIGPWVLKCQVHAGGRGKAGAVKVIHDKAEVYNFAQNWLGKRLRTYQTGIHGQPVTKILIEAATHIDKELYLGVVVDHDLCRVVCMVSTQGGIDIEKVAENNPHLIHKVQLDPLTGPQPYQARKLAFALGLNKQQMQQFTSIFMGLTNMFLECDLSLAEINPLVITKQGNLMCLDGKLSIDSNALFRQTKICKMYDPSQEDPRESYSKQWKLNYVALDGNIGCMVNGAGLAMGTMDIVKKYGGKPANFLDVGGSVTQERVTEAFKIILSDNAVKVIFVNIFGGIVRCDLIADGIINAVTEVGFNIPVVVRLEGNNAKLAAEKLMLSKLNIISETSLANAAKRVVIAAGE